MAEVSYASARLRLLRAFHGRQKQGELGADFDLQATREVTLEVAGEMLGKIPRKTKRAMDRTETDFLLNTLQLAIARGFVAGVRWGLPGVIDDA